MKDCTELYPIFILDPWFAKNMRVSVNRWRLFIVRGRPADVFPELFKKWKVTRLAFEVDTEPYARKRDAEVARLAAEHGIQVIQKVSHTLYDTESSYLKGSVKHSWVCNFKKPETHCNSLTPSTTVLSPYLKFGCLSVRTFWWKLTDIYHERKHTDPPVSLHGQLLWREFFYTAGAGIPNFDKMEGNPVCVQVDWDDNQEYLNAWREQGRTGYPFIDAIMTQLRTEGWIHHLARHAVACFLTRGDLWISWEEGQKVFEELLLDADWSLNAGNWQWLSASAFFHQFFRVYSPVAFGKKTDKSGEYIKKYLPILQKFPSDYIYEPWKAPRSLQERAGCIIGKDYPKPIVMHEEVCKRNIERMKAAYAQRSPNMTAKDEVSQKKGVNRKCLEAPLKSKVPTKKLKR
ncbi:hypothetical protein JD844_031338 [Phrynosoma platyrhinos]|uniref:Photolyase/cryptochrome alpha/beta domain-containing protein n=1 Tax=Phrynosoma platyrhinos TaxID=52577 RepID=A0ABQ7T183_PHRPL|nr:hypothetical protein JD844_031338 [Phrynosoma platyrhinos]